MFFFFFYLFGVFDIFVKFLGFLRFLWNFWVGLCWFDVIWSCIALLLHYSNISCILDVWLIIVDWVLVGLDWVLPMMLLIFARHLHSFETNQGKIHWTKLISSKPYLLKSRIVQDVCLTSIVHQHPSNRIVSDKQSDDDGIVWGWWTLSTSLPVNVMACSSVVLVLGDCLESWTFCTTFRYVFLDLDDCPVEFPPMITLISPS